MNKIKNWIINHKKTTIAIGIGAVLLVSFGTILLTLNQRQAVDSAKNQTTNSNTKVVETKKDASGKEVKVEVVKDEKGNVVSEKLAESNTTTVSSTATSNTTNANTNETTTQETKVNDTTTKKVVKVTESIPFKTIDNYASSQGKARVYQVGENGQKEISYEITYVNGTETSRNKTNEIITVQPKNEIIERYVEVTPRKTEMKEVEDKNQPIYKQEVIDRWFVKDRKGNMWLFYSAKEASDKSEEMGNKGFITNWGTYEPEYKKELVGYKTTTQEVVVQEATYEWKR